MFFINLPTFVRYIIYILLLITFSGLNDNSDGLIKFAAGALWVLSFLGAVVVEKLVIPRLTYQKIHGQADEFWRRQIGILEDPSIPPTHSLDPEFGYMVLDEDEESEESEENTDVDTNPYPTHLAEKANNDDDLTPEEVIALIPHVERPSFLLQRLPESEQNNRAVAEAGVRNMGTFLRYVSPSLADDDDLVNLAVEHGANALDFASVRIRDEKSRWAAAWPNLSSLLFNDAYPRLDSNSDDEFFFNRVQQLINDVGPSLDQIEPGHAIGFFGSGLVHGVCHYKHESLLTDQGLRPYTGSIPVGASLVVERLYRFYFKFITNGNFDDQPFVRVTHQYKGGSQSAGNAELIDVRWFDNFTNSALPSSHPAFFARLCYDVKGPIPEGIYE